MSPQHNEPLTEIIQTMNKSKLETIINDTVEEHVNSMLGEALSRAQGKLDDITADVESLVSSARDELEIDDDDVETLKETLVEEIMTELKKGGGVSEDVAPPPTVAERYASGNVTLPQALQLVTGRSQLFGSEVEQLLKWLAADHETDFALFLWRNKNGNA